MSGIALNRTQMTVSTGGTGDITLGSASVGFLSFADAGAVDGGVYSYLIIDGSAWEYGYMTYHASTTSFSRTAIVGSSNSNAAINVTTAATVACVDLARGYVAADMTGSSIGLGTSYTDIPGCSINLAPGLWDIYGQINGGMTGTGTVVTQIYNTTDGVGLANGQMSHNGGYAWTLSMKRLALLTAPKSIKLRARRDTGSNVFPSTDAGAFSTYIQAVQIG